MGVSAESGEVLENVREMWTEVPHGGKKKAKPVNKAREAEQTNLYIKNI